MNDFLTPFDEDEDVIPVHKKRKHNTFYSSLPATTATSRVIRMYAKQYNKTTMQLVEDILYDYIVEQLSIERNEDA
jgi:hypothetical protein